MANVAFLAFAYGLTDHVAVIAEGDVTHLDEMPIAVQQRGMAKGTTKVRPRNHVIASISVHAISLIISREGHAVDVPTNDYGTDLSVSTFDPVTRDLEPEFFNIQLKATDRINLKGGVVKFDVSTNDLRTWARNLLPFFLIVFDTKTENGYWLHIQQYIADNKIDLAALTTKQKRVEISVANLVDSKAVEEWRSLKEDKAKELSV